MGTNYAQCSDLKFDLHSVDVDDVAPPTIKLSVAKRHESLLSSFLLEDSLYFGVNEIISFQKLGGIVDKLTIANLGRQQQRSLDSYFKSSCELYLSLFEVIGYYCIPSIVLLTLISYTYLCSYYLCFRIPSII